MQANTKKTDNTFLVAPPRLSEKKAKVQQT